MRRVLCLFALAAVGGGLAACALVSGINGFTEMGLDASATTVTKPADARPDSPSMTGTDDSPSEDDTNEEPPPVDDADDTGDAGDASDGAPGDESVADGPTGADVDAEPAPEDAGDAAPPPTDAGDGGSPLDAGDGGCSMPVIHANGLGQFFSDCVPLGTYNAAQAAKACAAAGAGACSPNTVLCGNADMECTTTANTCMCWTYAGTTAGRARASGAGVVCQCPTATDPLWN
jgi:hypothetical protein